MTRTSLEFVSLLIALSFAAGCAGNPPSTNNAGALPATRSANSSVADCRELEAGIANAENAKRTAQEKERDAWKAVIPFAVMARKASSKADAEKAGKQLEKLHVEYTRQDCERTGV